MSLTSSNRYSSHINCEFWEKILRCLQLIIVSDRGQDWLIVQRTSSSIWDFCFLDHNFYLFLKYCLDGYQEDTVQFQETHKKLSIPLLPSNTFSLPSPLRSISTLLCHWFRSRQLKQRQILMPPSSELQPFHSCTLLIKPQGGSLDTYDQLEANNE